MNIRDLISSAIGEIDAEIQQVRDSAQAQIKHLDGAEAGVARFVEILMGKVAQIGQQETTSDTDQPNGEALGEAATEVTSDAEYAES